MTIPRFSLSDFLDVGSLNLLLQIVDSLKRGHQVMVFVHSRKDTGKTGRILAELAAKNGELNLFETEGDDPRWGLAVRDVGK